MTGLIIRPASHGERKALEALQWRASLMWEEYREALLAHPDAIALPDAQIADGRVLVAEFEGRIAGFAVVLRRADGDAELDGLFVEPGRWRKGVGTRLVRAAEKLAPGARHLHVIANPRAEGFDLPADSSRPAGRKRASVPRTRCARQSANLNKYFSFTTIPFGEYFITTGVDISDIRIAQRGLEEHARKLERSNAELQQFAYVASHDLQEPLRMVTAYLGLLKKKYGDQLDGKAKDYMDIAIDGGLRARGLIQDLLEFSRVGSQAKVFRPTNMEKVLAKALENLMIRIGENNALITHDHLPTIMADDSQMTQVMQNLIGNAIKFHGTEPPMVHISCKDEGTEWCFSVSDNGIGIDPQYRDKIFVLFQRLHARNEYEGTGIGLAICKKIIELHGGKIWFDSRPGSGTTFYFTVSKGTGK